MAFKSKAAQRKKKDEKAKGVDPDDIENARPENEVEEQDAVETVAPEADVTTSSENGADAAPKEEAAKSKTTNLNKRRQQRQRNKAGGEPDDQRPEHPDDALDEAIAIADAEGVSVTELSETLEEVSEVPEEAPEAVEAQAELSEEVTAATNTEAEPPGEDSITPSADASPVTPSLITDLMEAAATSKLSQDTAEVETPQEANEAEAPITAPEEEASHTAASAEEAVKAPQSSILQDLLEQSKKTTVSEEAVTEKTDLSQKAEQPEAAAPNKEVVVTEYWQDDFLYRQIESEGSVETFEIDPDTKEEIERKATNVAGLEGDLLLFMPEDVIVASDAIYFTERSRAFYTKILEDIEAGKLDASNHRPDDIAFAKAHKKHIRDTSRTFIRHNVIKVNFALDTADKVRRKGGSKLANLLSSPKNKVVNVASHDGPRRSPFARLASAGCKVAACMIVTLATIGGLTAANDIAKSQTGQYISKDFAELTNITPSGSEVSTVASSGDHNDDLINEITKNLSAKMLSSRSHVETAMNDVLADFGTSVEQTRRHR